MKWIVLIAAVIAAAFYFIPVKVAGTVYVVTNSRQTVAMPLTEVRVYDKSAFLKAWNEQSLYRLSNSCDQSPTEAEKAALDLRRLRYGPNGAPNWHEMNSLYQKCNFDALIWENSEFQPIATLITDRNGDFSFSANRFSEVILLSKGSRAVIGSEENYIWLLTVPVSTVALTQTIELNNHNQVGDLLPANYPL